MLAAVLLLDPDLAAYRRDPRLPPEPPRLLDLGEAEPPEDRGELERGDGELTLGEGRLGADCLLTRGELCLLGWLDCLLTRGEGEGLDRTCGTRERAGEVSTDRGVRREELGAADPPIRPDREDPRSTCGVEREDELRSTLDWERTGAVDVLDEPLLVLRFTGPLSIELLRRCKVPRSVERVVEPPRSGADVVAREPRAEPLRSTVLLRGCNLPLVPRSGAA